MSNNKLNFTFLDKKQIFGFYDEQLDIFKRHSYHNESISTITDFAILLGGKEHHQICDYNNEEIIGPFGTYWLKNAYFHGSIKSPRRTIITNDYKNERTLIVVLPKDPSEQYRPMPLGKIIWNQFGDRKFIPYSDVFIANPDICLQYATESWESCKEKSVGARPVISYSLISSELRNLEKDENGNIIGEFGEYVRNVVDENLSKILENEYLNSSINQTGKDYTTDSINLTKEFHTFQPRKHIEYEYNGEKYIRFVIDSNPFNDSFYYGKRLTDGRKIKTGEVYWLKVEPIRWLIDKESDIVLAKEILFSGINFKNERDYKGNFENTNIKKFMDECFSKDIIPSSLREITDEEKITNNKIKKRKL